MGLSELRSKVDQLKGRRDQVKKYLEETKTRLKESTRSQRSHEQAAEVIKEVGLQTQSQISFHISDTVSLALNSVFDTDYEFEAEFVQRRNKTECDLVLYDGEDKINPLLSTGGGVVDVISFALRCASWSIDTPKKRPIMILDEPFKYLSSDLMPLAGEMLKKISKELGLQIIMVSHEKELIDVGDKIFHISKDKRGRSQIELDG
jgi:DNA repair exonuclease SbcCD ATPase subunit